MLNYNKRDAVIQSQHDEFVRRQLRSLSTKEPEFLGYAEDDHRLAKKDFGLHPRVPMFQFDHIRHGSMEMTTRGTLNGTFITAAHSGHPTHLLGRRQIQDLKQKMKRQEVYDKELFQTVFSKLVSMVMLLKQTQLLSTQMLERSTKHLSQKFHVS